MKAGIFILLTLLLSLSFSSKTFAADEVNASGASATFAANITAQSTDTRARALQKYLEIKNSPLAPYASVFVNEADINKLPWDLVIAISGTESTLGQQAPTNCNNFYGYGIYADNVLCFTSVEDGIKTVSKALRETYMNKWGAQTVDDIGRLYAASPAWSGHTKLFMKQIEDFKQQYDQEYLPISL